MTARTAEPLGINNIQIEYLPLFLKSRGWYETYRDEGRQAVYRKRVGEDEEEVLVPLRTGFRDYAYVVQSLVDTVSRVEGEPQRRLLDEIRFAGSDTMRVRLSHPQAQGGVVPLDIATRLINGARNLVLAAAYAASRPTDLVSEPPREVVEYMSTLQVGEIEYGSIAVTIRSPLSPIGQEQPQSALPDNATSNLFARRAFLALSIALSSLRHITRVAPGRIDYGIFVPGAISGLSVRLCDAFLDAAVGGDADAVDYEIRWSPLFDAPSTLDTRFQFGKDAFGIVGEAALSLASASNALAIRETSQGAEYTSTPYPGHFVADNSTFRMIDALSEVSHGPNLDVSSAFVDAFGIASLEEAASAGAVRLLVGCDLNEMPTAKDIITFENAHVWRDTGIEPIERAPDDNSITPAVRTLRMDSVKTKKSAAKNHSKLYVDQNVGIVGSSNLTRAGMLGQRELNLLQRRPDAVARLRQWYDSQWTSAEKAEREPFKDRLIEWLENARVERYAPFHPYAKALFERFRHRFLALAPSAGDVDLAIFQQEGRDAALSILAEHRCCIIADAVGMGKTFVALGAVQRRAQTRPRNQRKALVICPAQLEGVWKQAGADQGVSLDTESMETLGHATAAESGEEERLRNLGRYAIVIVDEAHNFRNPLANRFTNLMRVLSDGPEDKEVLLLTATPINNGIGDLYSLYRLMTRDNDAFFQTTNLRMSSLKEFFKKVEKGHASTTDLLLETMVCRSRLDIRRRQEAGEVIVIGGKDVRFPNRSMTALDYSLSASATNLTYLAIGAAIEQLTLGAYNVEQYAAVADNRAEERYRRLQDLFKILLLKRLESSVTAFVSTGERLLSFSDAVVNALRQGRKLTNDDFRRLQQDFATALFDDDDDDDQGSVYLQALAEKDPANYDVSRLAADVSADHALLDPLLAQARSIRGISDGKIARLKQVLASKLPGEKVLLFTFYSDTADYIRQQLTGDKAFMSSIRNARVEAITGKMRPADKSRMVREFAPIANGRKDDPPKSPIQLLISTDVLAEGQNLQDCGCLINYDLHFNPVRMIQRNGRIDRLFSEHKEITIANFFPEEDLDSQLRIVTKLQEKIARIQENMPTDSSVIGEAVRVFSLDELRRTRAGDATIIDEIDARNPINVFQNTLSFALKLLLDFGIEQVEKIPFGCQSNKHSTHTGLFLCVRARSEAYPNTCWWLLYPDALNPAAEPMREVSEILPLIETPKPGAGIANSPDLRPRDIHWPAILDAERRCRSMLVEQVRSSKLGQTWAAGHINRKLQQYFAPRPVPLPEDLSVRLGKFDLSRHKADAEGLLKQAREDNNSEALEAWLQRTLPTLDIPKDNPETVVLEFVCYLELVPENQQALTL